MDKKHLHYERFHIQIEKPAMRSRNQTASSASSGGLGEERRHKAGT